MSTTRKPREHSLASFRVLSVIVFLLFTVHLQSNAQTTATIELKDTPYLDECKEPRSESHKSGSIKQHWLISDLVFPNTHDWKPFSEFPKISNDKKYQEIFSRFLDYFIKGDPSLKPSFAVTADATAKEIYDFFRYIPMKSDIQLVYSGRFLPVDGNFGAIIPDQPNLDPIDISGSRILRANPRPGRDTEYVGAYWYYIAGNNEEYFERGVIFPPALFEKVDSIGLLCIPETAKKIRIETNIGFRDEKIVRFSPNIDTFRYFYFSPGSGNELGTYSGGKTNILMVYEEDHQKLWALIQFGFKTTEKNILSSKIGWIEVDSLKLDADQQRAINQILSP